MLRSTWRCTSLVIALLFFQSIAYAARNDVLVIVNDNSTDSPQVGAYYAAKRDIDPSNIVHVRTRDSYFISWTEFKILRNQIIVFMQQKMQRDSGITPVVCTDGEPPYYCQVSMDQLRANTKVRYIVTTRGVPARMTVDGSSAAFDPNSPTSVDNYLRTWLINYFTQDVIFDLPPANPYDNNRSLAFKDGRGMRAVLPAMDKELIVGRLDGITLTAATALLDRTLSAESNGIYGKLYSSTQSKDWVDRSGTISGPFGLFRPYNPAWRYQLGLFGEPRQKCVGNLNYAYNTTLGKTPVDCLAQMNDGLYAGAPNDPPPGLSYSRQPKPNDGLVYLGQLDGQATTGSFTEFLNWRRNSTCTSTLCATAADPAACRAASIDVYKEIDTRCVGVADGFIGYNYQSFPVSYLTLWPTGWNGPEWGDNNKVAFPEIRSDIGYDDTYSLWFRNTDQISSPVCYAGTDLVGLPAQPCLDERAIHFRHVTGFTPKAVNLASPQTYSMSFRYKTANLTKTSILRIHLRIREKYDDVAKKYNYITYGPVTAATLPAGTSAWLAASTVTFTLDPTKHTRSDYLFDEIVVTVDTSSTVVGDLGFDNFSIRDVAVNAELAVNGSFQDGYKQVSTGDHAANFLSRLNGVAFWGSLGHHGTGGFSFASNHMETLVYFMRGLPLGDAVWYAELGWSGILYGDPLYSPIAVRLNPSAPNDEDRIITDSVKLYGSTVNGRDPARVYTAYSVEYCPGSDFYVCDQNGSWTGTGISGVGGGVNAFLGTWSVATLASSSYTLRLSVTSTNNTIGRSQTFYDYYPVKVKYADSELSFSVTGRLTDSQTQPLANVTLNITGPTGTATTVTTDANGYFTLTGARNGTYTIASSSGVQFYTPTTSTVDWNNLNLSLGADAKNFYISGRTLSNTGEPLAGVSIQIDGPSGRKTAISNVNGYYIQGGLATGTYTLTPLVGQGLSFTAVNGSTAILNGTSNVLQKDFTATPGAYAISGRITTGTGAPLPGVIVNILGFSTGSNTNLITNQNGYYLLGGLPNDVYAVGATLAGFAISNTGGTGLVTINGSDSTKNFVGIASSYSLSGTVVNAAGTPLSGVQVTASDGAAFSTTVTTDTAGRFTKTGLKNGKYIVMAQQNGVAIMPSGFHGMVNINNNNLYVLFVSEVPTISAVWPETVATGGIVFVFGHNFTTDSKVEVNGVSAPLVQWYGNSTLIFILPSGATPGPIKVTTSYGSAISRTNFGAPLTGFQITGLSPMQIKPSQIGYVVGSGFESTTKVKINNVDVPLVQYITPSLLLVILPTNATSAPVTLTNSNGASVTSTDVFTVIP